MIFKKVTYVGNDEIGGVIARVEENSGELQLNKNIFDNLPEGFKEFVLYHEEGHLVLNTGDEFKANLFAIHQYIPADVTTDELGRRIIVMTQALTPGADQPFRHGIKSEEPTYRNFDIATIAATIGGAVGSISNGLVNLGIGNKARINETNAAAKAQTSVIYAQADAAAEVAQITGRNTNNIILLGGGVLIVVMIIYLMFK